MKDALRSSARWRGTLGWALVAVCALGAPARSADPQVRPYVGVDPGSVVDLDLRAGGSRIEEPLPFDVQFFFQGKTEDEVTRVDGRYLGSKQPRFCGELYPEEVPDQDGYLVAVDPSLTGAGPAPPPPAPTSIELRILDRDGGSLRSVSLPAPAPRAATPAAATDPLRPGERSISFVRFIAADGSEPRKVELSVPGVLPNRYYCFRFQIRRSVRDLLALRRALAKEIEEELRSPDYLVPAADPGGRRVVRTTNSWRGYYRIRVDLIQAIKRQLRPGETIVAPEGSFFNPENTIAEVTADYLGQFTDILARQDGKYQLEPNIEQFSQGATAALQQVLQSPAFAALRAAPEVRLMLPNAGRVLDLANVDAAARGLEPAVEAPPVADVWDPAELEARIGRLSATLSDLKALRQLTTRPDLPASIDRGGLAALRDLLDSRAIPFVDAALFELSKLQTVLREREEAILALVDEITIRLGEFVYISGTSIAPYEVRAGWYLSADVGQAWAGDLDELFTYVGTNIYFRPVNKKAPLSGGGFRKRFAVVLGISNDKLDKAQGIEGVIGDSPLMIGGGFRISDHFRLSAGALIVREQDPSPLVSGTSLGTSWFVSASVDWNVRRLFARFGSAFNLADTPAGDDE